MKKQSMKLCLLVALASFGAVDAASAKGVSAAPKVSTPVGSRDIKKIGRRPVVWLVAVAAAIAAAAATAGGDKPASPG